MVSLADGQALERALDQPANSKAASVDVDNLPTSIEEDKPETHEVKAQQLDTPKESLNKETAATEETANDERVNAPAFDDETKASVVPAEAPAASNDALTTPATAAVAEPELVKESVAATEPEVSSPVTNNVQFAPEPKSLVADHEDKEEPPKATEDPVESNPVTKSDEPVSPHLIDSPNDKAAEPEALPAKEDTPIALTDEKSELAAPPASKLGSDTLASQSAEEPTLVPKDEELPTEVVNQEPEAAPVQDLIEPVSQEVEKAAALHVAPEPTEQPTIAHEELVPEQPEPAADEEPVKEPKPATEPGVEPIISSADVPEQPAVDTPQVEARAPEPEPTPLAVVDAPIVENDADEVLSIAKKEHATAVPVTEQKEPEKTDDAPTVGAEAVAEPLEEHNKAISEPVKEDTAVEATVTVSQEEEKPAPSVPKTQDERKEEEVAVEPAPQEEPGQPAIPAPVEEPTEEAAKEPSVVPEVTEAAAKVESAEESSKHEAPPVEEETDKQEVVSAPAEAELPQTAEPEVPEAQADVEQAKTDIEDVPSEKSAEATALVNQMSEPSKDETSTDTPEQTSVVETVPEPAPVPVAAHSETSTVPPPETQPEPIKEGTKEEPAAAAAPPTETVGDNQPEQEVFVSTVNPEPSIDEPATPEPSQATTEAAVAEPEKVEAPSSVEPVQEVVQIQADEVAEATVDAAQVDITPQDEPSSEPVTELAPATEASSSEKVVEPTPIETPTIVTDDSDETPALSIDTETLSKTSEIERPKSPWTPSYSVISQGPGVVEGTGEPSEEAPAEVQPSLAVETEPTTEKLPSTDTPKSPNWTPSYSVSQQGSPLPPMKELEPIETDVPAAVEQVPEQSTEQILESVPAAKETDLPVIEVPVVLTVVEPQAEHKISTPVLELPEDIPEEPKLDEAEASKSPSWTPSYSVSQQGSPLLPSKELEAQQAALNGDEPSASIQNGVDEAPKSPSWTPSYSVSRQGSPLLAPKELTMQDEIPVANKEPESAPAMQLPEASKEVERPSSPWTPSYSVTNQGPDTEEPKTEEAVDETVLEPPTLNLPPSENKPADIAAAIERPSSPWTPSYSVTKQTPDEKVEEEVEPSTVAALQASTGVEQSEAAPGPVTEGSEKLQPSSPSWTPSYSVSRQGSPLLESQELPTVSEPEVVPQSTEKDEFIMPQTFLVAESKTNEIPADPQAEQAQLKPEANLLSPAADEPERPDAPWTPSYSVSRQGSPLVSPKELEPAPATEKPEAVEVPQVVIEGQAPAAVEPTATETPKSASWTPSYSVSHQGASASAEEGLDKLEQLPNLKSTETFPESDKTRPPLQLDTQAAPAAEPVVSPRSRLESNSSSRFFPGGWFSSSPKVPDEGRTSLDNAHGEITPARPHAEVESPKKSPLRSPLRSCLIM